MSKADILYLGLVCGLPPEHDFIKSAMADPETVMALGQGIKLSKDDVLYMIHDGRSIFDYSEVWKNFSKIEGYLARSGESFQPQDLDVILPNYKSLVQNAAGHNAVDMLFSPGIWKGRMTSMEEKWYSLPKNDRRFSDFQQIRREVAKAEGRVLREDQLERMGYSQGKLAFALRNGRLKEAMTYLESSGDRLRKEDMFLRDSDNQTILDFYPAWDHFEQWYPELLRHDDGFTVEDFLATRVDSRGPLATVVNHNMLHKVFRAEFWAKNPQDMLRLYSHVPEDKKAALDIDGVLADIIEINYGQEFDVALMNHPDEFMRPVPGPELKGRNGQPITVFPGMLKTFWESFNTIVSVMDWNQNPMTLAHLRRRSPLLNESFVHTGIRYGKLETILHLARESGEGMRLDDFCRKNGRGQTALSEVIRRKQAALLFAPDLWVGRVQEMLTLWNEMPQDARRGIDIHVAHSQANRMSLRRAAASRPSPMLS